MRLLALLPLLSLACATARPPMSPARADNHVLLVNHGGFVETSLAVESFARGPFTVALWMAVQHPRGPWAWALGEGDAGTFVIGKAEAAPRVHASVGGVALESGDVLEAGRFTHVALVGTARELLLYVDGKEVARKPRATPRNPAEGPLRLGHRRDAYAIESFIGALDDLWVLSDALEAAAVAAIAQGGAPAEKPLVHLDFERDDPSLDLRGDARRAPARLGELAPRLAPNHETQLSIPFDGEWLVIQGFEGPGTHQGYAAFALDLQPATESGGLYTGDGKRNEDWFCFDRALLAPADGVVVRVDEGVVDAPPGPITSSAANRVILEHRPGEWSELVHVRKGSIVVQVGQRVTRGQPIARCGNAGAGAPHLHYALLGSIDPILSRPFSFSAAELRAEGHARAPLSAPPIAGDRVRALAPAAPPSILRK